MDDSSLVCYLRTPGRPWQPAPRSYARLLQLYDEMMSAQRRRTGSSITLCTTAEDGSMIMAHLQAKPHMAGVYLCRIEGANEEVIELMRGPRALGGR